MINPHRNAFCWAALLSTVVLTFLLFGFGRYFQNGSHDLVQHYMLVDELMKHGGVRPGAFERIGAMAFYPPAAHWMATLIGWIGGSGVIGIDLVTIIAAFATYLLVLLLVVDESPAALLAFMLGFLALTGTASLVGWEVVGNFFFPQLVGDAFYFAALLLMSRSEKQWSRIAFFLVIGTLTMWVQPLNAIHIMATGCVVLSLEALRLWNERKSFPWAHAGVITVVAAASAAIIVVHPAFRAMERISYNDGSLGFGYVHILRVDALCFAICAANAWRCLRGKASRVDMIICSAGLAASLLVVVQLLALKLLGAGSDYAVKKHMFLVVTAILMNATRLVVGMAGNVGGRKFRFTVLAIPLLAGYMSTFALQGFVVPVAPTVRALAYADHAVSYRFPEFKPSSTAANISSLPLISNILISLSAFQHPFDDQVRGWQIGKNIMDGMQYVMIGNTADVADKCPIRYAETSEFVIVNPECLKTYRIGETVNFASNGNGRSYLDRGWGESEPWGTWAVSNKNKESTLSLNLQPNDRRAYELTVDSIAFIAPGHPYQGINVTANGVQIASWAFSASAPMGIRTAIVPAELIRDGKLRLTFVAPDGVSPKQLGVSEDPRVLGIGIKTLSLKQK